jgi:hypothetical protein
LTYPPFWPAALRQALAAKVSNPLQYETMVSFLTSANANSQVAVNPSRNYRDMPLVVLSATVQPEPPGLSEVQKAETARFNAVFGQKHDELAALSSRGVNARVPGANHFIQRTKPQAVLDAVAEVVSEARAKGRNRPVQYGVRAEARRARRALEPRRQRARTGRQPLHSADQAAGCARCRCRGRQRSARGEEVVTN